MNDRWLTSSHPSRQSCDRRLLPISTSAANAGRGGSLHDAEPLGWTGEEASHAAMSQHAKLPQRHLPVHAALQALIQCKWKKAAQSTSVHKNIHSRLQNYTDQPWCVWLTWEWVWDCRRAVGCAFFFVCFFTHLFSISQEVGFRTEELALCIKLNYKLF